MTCSGRKISSALLTIMVTAPAVMGAGPGEERMMKRRVEMVREIRAGVTREAPKAADEYLNRSLTAIGEVPREAFVPEKLRNYAYNLMPLPIGYEQTATDAYAITIMTAALRLPEHATVLDIGTGSGYQAAILARLSSNVYSIEIVEPLAISAQQRLAALGYSNVRVRAGDGFEGWPEHAPFDGIVVAAGAANPPQPLLDQLKVGGRLVMPIGPNWATEELLVITKTGPQTTTRCSLGWTMFVPLTGRGERERQSLGLLAKTPLCFDAAVLAPTFVKPEIAKKLNAAVSTPR